jgi:GNAT superfamily N-acetyltransferase
VLPEHAQLHQAAVLLVLALEVCEGRELGAAAGRRVGCDARCTHRQVAACSDRLCVAAHFQRKGVTGQLLRQHVPQVDKLRLRMAVLHALQQLQPRPASLLRLLRVLVVGWC